MSESDLISAQVVLTSDAAAAAPEVLEAFRRAGFAVGALVANNFSITASPATFKKFFRARLTSARDGIRDIDGERVSALEVPGDALPDALKDKVSAVLFTRPPDFGPGANF
jgi:hypothetical protein